MQHTHGNLGSPQPHVNIMRALSEHQLTAYVTRESQFFSIWTVSPFALAHV